MKTINRSIIFILLGTLAGIFLYGTINWSVFVIIAVGTLSFCALIILHLFAKKKSFSELPFIIGICILFICIGYFTRYRTDVLQHKNHYSHFKKESSQTVLFSIEKELKPSQYQYKYIAKLHRIDTQAVSGTILLNLSKDSLAAIPKIGQWYHSRTTLEDLPVPKNPYQFDYGKYLKKQQIYGQLFITSNEMLLSNHTTESIWVWSSRFRESIKNKLHKASFTQSQLAVMDALLLGQRQGIASEMNADYAAAGMMHILAVSGLHVGIVLLILRFLTRFINWHSLRWTRSIIIIALIWGFAFITGLSPSVLRAATMFSFLEIGKSLGGDRNTKDGVLISALVLLLYDPMLIYQVGFQLSYLAVLMILWSQPWMYSLYKPRFYLDKIVWSIITVTTAAQLGVTPLSIFYFHQFPGLFLVSNIVILPFLTIILSVGIGIAFMAVIWKVPDSVVYIYGSIIDAMNNFIHWIASKEIFVLKNLTISVLLLFASYISMIIFIRFFKKYTSNRLYLAIGAILIFTTTLVYDRFNDDSYHFAILHQNKNSILIHLEKGHLQIYSSDTITESTYDYQIQAYRNAITIEKENIEGMGNYFRLKRNEILVIDSLGIYNIQNASPNYIVLTQSPKINLNRLISRYPTATIIADGSNYKSYVKRWENTCIKQKIPFHSTYEKGAFIIE